MDNLDNNIINMQKNDIREILEHTGENRQITSFLKKSGRKRKRDENDIVEYRELIKRKFS